MTHPLESLVAAEEGFVLIGHSGEDRFPGFSYNAYTRANKRFYCLDMGGLTESRGPTKGGPVYTSVADLPAERSDLAIVWVKPRTCRAAVDLAHDAGCRRIWFSFHTGHPDAVAHAVELGMEVVEVGRCPIYYLEGAPAACRMHTLITRISGTRKRPPQTTADLSLRVMA